MLVKVTRTEDGKQLVSARELYGHLEVGRRFTTWIKARIEKYQFQENLDFTIVENFSQNGEKVGRPQQDYIITMDMAKELSMIENNDKGREARRYFIRCEEELRSRNTLNISGNSRLKKIAALVKENSELEAEQKRIGEKIQNNYELMKVLSEMMVEHYDFQGFPKKKY